MSRATLLLAALVAAAPAAAEAPASGNGTAASVVYVQVFRSPYDWSQPWRQEPVSGASGSGFLIDGGRILTNGHVIADARQVLVRRPDEANPYVATVEAAGNDCDLAVLRVADPAFARGLRPLRLGPLPRAGTRVNTYGFPLGGQDVSSTAGIVSRIESRGYVHSGADAHLVVQTDAAINPGNSGGPVVQDGKVVGVAFQGFPGADNMGFFIPVPIVRHFLANLEDGRYDGFPGLGAADGAAPVPGLPPRARPAARTLGCGGRPRGARRDGRRRRAARATCSRPSRATRSRTTARSGSATRASPTSTRSTCCRWGRRRTSASGATARSSRSRRPRGASRATTATGTATRWRPTTWSTPVSSSCGSRWSC